MPPVIRTRSVLCGACGVAAILRMLVIFFASNFGFSRKRGPGKLQIAGRGSKCSDRVLEHRKGFLEFSGVLI